MLGAAVVAPQFFYCITTCYRIYQPYPTVDSAGTGNPLHPTAKSTDCSTAIFSSIRYHGSSSSIKCNVYHHVGGGFRRHTPVVCNETREPHTRHYPSRPETKNKASQVGAISKAQKYSRNNYWKKIFKKVFGKKVTYCQKTQKEVI